MLQRPVLPAPIIGFNQYQRYKEDLKLQELRNFREMIQRKFPQTGVKDAMLEPLKTPEMRKKKMESLKGKKRADYLEALTHFNTSGAPEGNGKFRFKKEDVRLAKKRTASRNDQ